MIVDADSCPVKDLIIGIAQKFMIASVSNCIKIDEEFVDVRIVDESFQQVDIAIANCVEKNDIVVTKDYGLVALVLSKECHAISPRGMIYTIENMENLLMLKHINAKFRKGGGKTKEPQKFSRSWRERFANNLIKLVKGIKPHLL